jgi:hypothetical protein
MGGNAIGNSPTRSMRDRDLTAKMLSELSESIIFLVKIQRFSKMLVAKIASNLQYLLMKQYGKFDEEGHYHPNTQMPFLVVRLLQRLGKIATLY